MERGKAITGKKAWMRGIDLGVGNGNGKGRGSIERRKWYYGCKNRIEKGKRHGRG